MKDSSPFFKIFDLLNVTRIETILRLKDPEYWGEEGPIVQKSSSEHPKLEARIGILNYNMATLTLMVIVVVALWY